VSGSESGAIWRRATLLVQQRRGDLARQELRRLLAIDPGFAPAHALLALLLADQDLDAARAEAEAAIAADPAHPMGHHALACVLREREDLDGAAAAIGRAIELDSEDADYRAVLAQVRLLQKRHEEALAAADAGLELDAQHTDCLNLRSRALVNLGRREEASDALDASLAHDPDNPLTHQARGFALLERRDVDGALRHFQEALRLDPTLEGARAGLVESLKARNPVYRWVLAWFLWLDRFTTGRQQKILLGAWLAMILGRGALAAKKGLEGAATALGFCWFGLVLLTTCAVPFFNLLLLLHPIGRHALPARQRLDAVLLCGALALAATAIALDLADAGTWSEFASLFAIAWLLPVASIGAVGDAWPRRAMQLFSLGLLAAWVWWAVELESLVAQADASGATSLPPDLAAHAGLHRRFLSAIALSTWFVLLVPKRRSRQAG
jgi:tetratricopeptide (TPR) repeat protein